MMSPEYEPSTFESHWQRLWQERSIYSADHNRTGAAAYVVDMFPYPSGNSMHVGHPRGYVATDVYARFKRMQGFRVLHPMGWDAFGLPAEETAIANKEYPAATVERNIEKFKSQLTRLGLGYDWTREINTTDPKFYRHTQRIFLEMFRMGLAFYETSTVNWCPELGTVLANEDVVDGRSERGGHPVIQQPMRQWTLRITAYASRLIDDLELLPDWPDKVKNAQRNWIGRSFGHTFEFETSGDFDIAVYTTRLDTLMGVTFLAVSPDSDLVTKILAEAENKTAIRDYIEESRLRSDRERLISKEKTGVIALGFEAIHPITGSSIPVLIADYVLAGYGSGAVMGVPAHDQRDEEVAGVFGFPKMIVVKENLLVNSGEFDGQTVERASDAIATSIGAQVETRFKMRDWVFSRQRFWGEPFPIVWVQGNEAYENIKNGECSSWLPADPITYENEGSLFYAVPVIPDHASAVQLPIVESYEPTGEPSGPLALIDSWVNAYICPKTGKISATEAVGLIPCTRETNTMPQWAGSSWYWLRYMDPANEQLPFSKEIADEWGPVTVYAGADHAVAHLIYARFWHKVLYDCGYVSFPEPFLRLEFLGYVLASDGTKISKRKGNSRNPDEVIDEVGADAFRLYEMAIGPFEKAVPWIDENLQGQRRFLERLWRFCRRVVDAQESASSADVEFQLHTCLKKVSEDIENFKFNTAVAALIIFLNEVEKATVSKEDLKVYVRIIAPFAPHFAEQIWAELDESFSVHHSAWPSLNEEILKRDTVIIPVQINGKRRAEIEVDPEIDEERIRDVVLSEPQISGWVKGKTIERFIYVKQKIVNIVI